jgi:LPXTG-motif cell wall-anchored protein
VLTRSGTHPVTGETNMNSVIYLIGLVVVVLAILSFLGLR